MSTDNEASSGSPTERAAAEVATVGSRKCYTNSCQLTTLAQAKESQEPQVQPLDDATLEQLFYGGKVIRTQSDGGLTTAQEEALYRQGEIPSVAEAEAMMEDEQGEISASTPTTIDQELSNPGLKFAKPTMPYPDGFNHKRRYHPVLEQVTRLLMRHGKLAVAQRVCTRDFYPTQARLTRHSQNVGAVLNYLRTAPAPIYSPKFPLLPGSPPASHLPLNPVLYMALAIDSVAPLLKVKAISGAGGGGRALEMPEPLPLRARRRIAFQWILDIINKKRSKGSGRKQLSNKIAEEIIAVVEGRSSVWEKRRLVHRLATSARANVGSRVRAKKTG